MPAHVPVLPSAFGVPHTLQINDVSILAQWGSRKSCHVGQSFMACFSVSLAASSLSDPLVHFATTTFLLKPEATFSQLWLFGVSSAAHLKRGECPAVAMLQASCNTRGCPKVDVNEGALSWSPPKPTTEVGTSISKPLMTRELWWKC